MTVKKLVEGVSVPVPEAALPGSAAGTGAEAGADR